MFLEGKIVLNIVLSVGVIQVSNSELKNPAEFCFDHCKEDLVCVGMNVLMIKRCLMSTMKKANGKVKSSQDVCKCKDCGQTMSA